MDYKTYCDQRLEAGKCNDAGDYLASIDIYVALVNSDISDLDKCKLCCDIAACCNKLEQWEQAEAWYDEAIRYEGPYSRCYAQEMKAGYYANRHLDAEAIAIYERLLPMPYQLESDKERIWRNLAILRNPRT